MRSRLDRFWSIVARLALCGFLCIPHIAFAKSKKTPPAPPPPPVVETPAVAPEPPPFAMLEAVDAPHDYLAEKFVDLVSDIDRFFGSDRNYQNNNDSVFQLDVSRVVGYNGQHRYVFDGRAKVHLPQTEKSLHLLIESNPDTNTRAGADQKVVTPATTANAGVVSYGAGVRYERTLQDRWNVSADGGLKFQGLDTRPFARSRIGYAVPLDKWFFTASETAFWFNTIGVGETTQMDFERPINRQLLFRASSNATWLKDTQNVDLRQDFSVFHKVDDRSALIYQASIVGITRPQAETTDFVLLMLYRYRLHKDWMFMEVSPQLHFPRDHSFKPSSLLSLKLEMLFDKPK